MSSSTRVLTLIVAVIVGSFLLALLGGFVAWAATESAMIFYKAGGDRLSSAQWMTVYFDAIQAGICLFGYRAVNSVHGLLREALKATAEPKFQ